jgi:hypothetical protein
MTPCPIATFARTLLALPANERRDSFATAVIEAGGTYPVELATCTPFEVQLAGYSALAHSEDAAICAWAEEVIKHADQVEDDGFLTIHPRLQQGPVPADPC